MIERLSGASGWSTVPRWTRCAPEGCHSNVSRPPPGHRSPLALIASKLHSPTSGSSRRSASSAVGWSMVPLLPQAASSDRACQARPVNVLLWHGWVLEGSGSNVATARLAEVYRRQGHDVTVVCQE